MLYGHYDAHVITVNDDIIQLTIHIVNYVIYGHMMYTLKYMLLSTDV